MIGHELAEAWVSIALRISIGITLGSLVVMILIRCFRLSASTRYGLWVVVVLQGLLWFTIPIPVGSTPVAARPVQTPAGEQRPSTLKAEPISHAAPIEHSVHSVFAAGTVHSVTSSAARLAPPLAPWVMLGWLCGVAGWGSLLVARYWLGQRALRLDAQDAPSGLLEACHRKAQQLGLRAQVRVVLSNQNRVPFVVGLLRPTIVLPASATRWSGQQRDSVLAHELGHLIRRDSIVELASQLSVLLNFANPLIWYARHQLAEAREQAVDDLVVQRSGQRPADYATSLLSLAESLSRPPAHAMFGISSAGRSLRTRIERILHPDRDRLGARRAWIVLMFGLMTGASALQLVPNSDAADSPASQQQRQPRSIHVEKALKWLSSQQMADGSIDCMAGRVGVTAVAGWAFLEAGSTTSTGPYSEQVKECRDFLVSNMSGTGFIGIVGSTMYDHAYATIFLARCHQLSPRGMDEDLSEPLNRAVDLIVESQHILGGWRYSPVPSPGDLSVTSCQIKALHLAAAAGCEVPKETLDRAMGFIKNCHTANGGFAYMPENSIGENYNLTAAAVASLTYCGDGDSDLIPKSVKYFHDNISVDVKAAHWYYGHLHIATAYQFFDEDSKSEFLTDSIRKRAIELLEESHESDHWSGRANGDAFATAAACVILQYLGPANR